MASDAKTGQGIYLGAPRGGLRNVSSYQVAGHPFVTGSGRGDKFLVNGKVHMIEFPYVCNRFTVINQTDAASDTWIKMHFQSGSGVSTMTSSGYWGSQAITAEADVFLNGGYVTLSGSDSVTFNSRCTKLFLSNLSANSCEYTVIADLTLIPTGSMYILTGSGITGHPRDSSVD